MTTHPEDAMTRERALIPGLTLVHKPLETYLIVREEDGDRELTATECEKLYALASAQQEPAPFADAEEAAPLPWSASFDEATKIKDANGDTIAMLSHTHLRGRRDGKQVEATAHFIVKTANAALRRYAGDGGVWQPIETAPHGVLVLVGWNDTMGVWNAETAYASQGWRRNGVSTMSRHGHATHWMPLPEPPPPARAKSSEKGGADV